MEGSIGGGTGVGGRLGSSTGHGGDADGYSDVRFGGAAVTLGDEMEVGRAGGRDGLRAVDGDVADAVDGDGGRVGGAPVKHNGLTLVDGLGISGDVGRWRGRGCSGGKRRGRWKGVGLLAAASGGEQSDGCAEKNRRQLRGWGGLS